MTGAPVSCSVASGTVQEMELTEPVLKHLEELIDHNILVALSWLSKLIYLLI